MAKKGGRYWIFAYDERYPSGGMRDFRFSFNTIDEFEDKLKDYIGYKFFQILDTETHFHYENDLGSVVKWICKNIGGEEYTN